MTFSNTDRTDLRRRLLAWYDRHRRVMPWRAAPGEPADPYAVWISEIMLQQTTVATVKPYFEQFLARWPTVSALAAADLDDVLHAWQGLGYYARARNLHRCAQVVAADHGGRFPDREGDLRGLPGVGAYTAAAVAAIAFDRPVVPVDGNVVRVLARMCAVDDPLPGAKGRIEALARDLADDQRPGDFAQALMDLGATVCMPRRPDCGGCPWAADCAARAAGDPETYPVKAARKARPVRRGIVFWMVGDGGAVLLRRRPEKGLLGGLMEFPSTDWRETDWSAAEIRRAAPLAADWRTLPGVVAHTFTHFHLELTVWTARVDGTVPDGMVRCRPADFADLALPTVMKKVARHAAGRLYSS